MIVSVTRMMETSVQTKVEQMSAHDAQGTGHRQRDFIGFDEMAENKQGHSQAKQGQSIGLAMMAPAADQRSGRQQDRPGKKDPLETLIQKKTETYQREHGQQQGMQSAMQGT